MDSETLQMVQEYLDSEWGKQSKLRGASMVSQNTSAIDKTYELMGYVTGNKRITRRNDSIPTGGTEALKYHHASINEKVSKSYDMIGGIGMSNVK